MSFNLNKLGHSILPREVLMNEATKISQDLTQ